MGLPPVIKCFRYSNKRRVEGIIKDRENVKKIAAYGLSILLFAAYIGILFSARNPQVSLEYRMYYIEHTLDAWPGNGGLLYILGTKETFSLSPREPGALNRVMEGWSFREESGRWTQGNRASVLYIFPEKIEVDLVLEMEVVQYMQGVSAEVYANDQWIGRMDEETGKQISIPIPKEYLKTDTLVLSFHIENPVSLAEMGLASDDRAPGIMMGSALINRRIP